MTDAKQSQDPVGDELRDPGADISAVHTFEMNMLQKLYANRHKAHWSTVTQAWLHGRLREEVAELADAIAFGKPSDVIDEAADVANFAMFIADNARRERDAK